MGDTFYLPHDLDFCGRAYSDPPHLSHIGDDLGRGPLLFDKSKPLGEHGLRWIKIHLANLYGYDMARFDECVQFVHDYLKDIYDSAERPMEATRWWTKADDPWQCPTTCTEVRNALTSLVPEEYMCSLPVHRVMVCSTTRRSAVTRRVWRRSNFGRGGPPVGRVHVRRAHGQELDRGGSRTGP